MPYPDRFYPVVDSVAWVARLTKLGVGTIQLRAKNLDDAAALTIVKEALAVTKGTSTKLVVNDYWRAAIDAGAAPADLDDEQKWCANNRRPFVQRLIIFSVFFCAAQLLDLGATSIASKVWRLAFRCSLAAR